MVTTAIFATDDDDLGISPAPYSYLLPQLGLCGSVGTGKTRQIIQRVADALARDPAARCYVFVPDHALAAEMQARLRDDLHAGRQIQTWRGLSRPDPEAPPEADIKMCRRGDDAKAVAAAGGDISALCGSEKRGFCQFHPAVGGECGYRLQGYRAAYVRVWVMVHASLGLQAPGALRRYTIGPDKKRIRVVSADFVAIDESFTKAMLRTEAVPIDMLDPTTWPTVPANRKDITPEFADCQFRQTLAAINRVVAEAPKFSRLELGILQAAGLSASECDTSAGFVWRCMVRLPKSDLPGAGIGAVEGLISSIAANNRRVLRVRKLIELVADVLAGRAAGASLKVSGNGAGRQVAMHWREPIKDDWLGAEIVHADATMNEAITRVWLPRLLVSPAASVAMPYVEVTQIEDRVFGFSSVIASRAKEGRGRSAASNNARRVQRVILGLAHRHTGNGAPGGPDVLVILPKALEDEFVGKLPPNVGTLHFGKLRGQDGFKGVAALLMVSRLQPGVEAIEDLAEVIFGEPVQRLPAKAAYPTTAGVRVMAGSTGRTARKVVFHPDLKAEAVRWSLCEAELVQAVGRGRGIHRTAKNPLEVVILTNVPLNDIPVTKSVTLADIWREYAAAPDPVDEFRRVGVLPMDWPGRGALLADSGLYENAVTPGERFRDWLRLRPGNGARMGALVSAVTEGCLCRASGESHIEYIKGHSPDLAISSACAHAPAGAVTVVPTPAAPAWSPFRYRRSTAKRAALIWIDPRHSDPRAVVESWAGPLGLFEPALPAKPTKARQSPEVELEAVPVPPAPTATAAPTAQLDGDAHLAAVPLGLPDVMGALIAAGALTADDRRRHMSRFRRDRGTMADRERRALARISAQIDPDVLARAGMAAAARKLGIPIPGLSPPPADAAGGARA